MPEIHTVRARMQTWVDLRITEVIAHTLAVIRNAIPLAHSIDATWRWGAGVLYSDRSCVKHLLYILVSEG